MGAMLDSELYNTMILRLVYDPWNDRYSPESASALLRGLHHLDDDSARVSVKLWAEEAREGLGGQVN
jgi:hypothetical protein